MTAPIQIRVYEDKLKIWNPVVLPEGWTVEKLLGEHASHPYNPGVANCFFRAGEIESWGRGIQRIYSACKEAGTPEPEIRIAGNDLWLEFPFHEEYKKSIGTSLEKTQVKTQVKTTEAVTNELRANPNMTLAQVADNIGKSVSAVERAAKKLKEQGRLKYIGPKKGGQWEVIDVSILQRTVGTGDYREK